MAADPLGPPIVEKSNDGLHWLMLALFLIILGFFILLNANSKFDRQTVSAVLISLEEKFGPLGRAGDFDEKPDTIKPAVLLDRLQRVIRTQMAVAEFDRTGQGTAMIVRVPLSSLFPARSDRLLPARSAMMQGIARALASPPPDVQYRLAVWVTVDPRAPVPGPDSRSRREAVARAGALVRALLEAGTPPEALKAGLARGRENWAAFHFAIETAGSGGFDAAPPPPG